MTHTGTDDSGIGHSGSYAQEKQIARGAHLSTDTGGTFTDFVYLDGNGIRSYKQLSTPRNPTECIARGLERFDSLASFSHGTTVATNAVLERKGDRTALLTTKGFGDVIFIGRQQRQHLYSFHNLRPRPLITRDDVFEVHERVEANGHISVRLDEGEVRNIAHELRKRGYRSAAVSYLFSFLNPEHEMRTTGILEDVGIRASRSSEVMPEYREYERTSTTLMDAYIKEKLGSYLASLAEHLVRYGISNYHVMESEGGVAPSRIIQRTPSKGLLSGPAGGVSGAVHVGKAIGLKNMITLDMGGTSTDIARITGLKPEFTSEGKISGLPLCRRSLNIVTIGAGGGSIASVDGGGALTVGPESAGAQPGPVCYDLGGEEVTVTDVNLLAGYLNPVDFLRKGRDLSLEKTRKAVKILSGKLGFDPVDTIQGVRKVVNHTMAAALRMVTTEAGKDPADYSLFAFGGAGPVHAASLARELGMKKVVVPFSAGMFSAYGILISDVVHSFSVTKVIPLGKPVLEEASRIFADFARKGSEDLLKSGITREQHEFHPFVDIRYRGQSYSLTIPFFDDLNTLQENFEKNYKEKYGYSLEGKMEIVNFRMEARGQRFLPKLPEIGETRSSEPYALRDCLFGEWMKVPIYRRHDLGAGFRYSGACVVEDNGSTVVIPPGSEITVDIHGNLEVKV